MITFGIISTDSLQLWEQRNIGERKEIREITLSKKNTELKEKLKIWMRSKTTYALERSGHYLL